MQPMDDPIRNHPTRAEQLDIMAGAIADLAAPGDRVLDLGCGTGYFIDLLALKRTDLRVTGVDLGQPALDVARARFGVAGYDWVQGDLSAPATLALPHPAYRFVTSALVFHDLSDDQKQALIGRVAGLLEPGGFFLLYDRLRLDAAELFPLQTTIWRRLERVHGAGMRGADDFPSYLRDLGDKNLPARLVDYQAWFAAAGLSHAVLHLHGNVALMAGSARG